MKQVRRDFRPDARSAVAWLYVAAATLLIVASWWSRATVALRMALLWVLLLPLLGGWGRKHLEEKHRGFLAALAGVGMVHLAVFRFAGLTAAVILYAATVAAVARAWSDGGRRRLIALLLRIVPPAAICVAAFQTALLARAMERATACARRNQPKSALRWNDAALAINGRLRIRAADDRLLSQRARLLDKLDRPAEALATMLRLMHHRFAPPEEESLRRLFESYLTTGSLESEIVRLSHPASLWRFDRLPLPDDDPERTVLLGLFVRNGLLDRLLVEYAQNGLRRRLDFRYLRKCLEGAPDASNGEWTAWREYFVAICETRLGWHGQARRRLRRLLKRWPAYHNALVWLERIARKDRERPRPAIAGERPGRIENSQMLGTRRGGFNVDDALWTALEVRAGTYQLGFEVKGLPAEGEWPLMGLYLDGELVMQKQVTSRQWTVVSHEVRFDGDGCHRLTVGFLNDLYKEVGGEILNRNLYLRRILITRLR